ncbi:MAG: ScpA family protein [Patescibacteria group bacterium]|nr:segregation/condensation protein A [Patescibacteria group bacterium]
MKYIKIANYTGPLGLVLELIEKRGLDINKIALVSVADQYLEYIRENKVKANEIADFLEIASKLVYIKSAYLIAIPEIQGTGKEEMESLEQRIKIYEKFRNAARDLEKIMGKKMLRQRPLAILESKKYFFVKHKKISKQVLLERYLGILKRLPESCILKQEKVKARIRMAKIISAVRERLKKVSNFSFFSVFRSTNKIERVLAFLAILELTRKKEARFFQRSFLGDIRVSRIRLK